MNTETFRTWVEISPAALRHNIETLRKAAGAGKALMCVVKANAYGHGLREVAGLLAAQTDYFGTANLPEAVVVREVAPDVPIFLLSSALPSERDEVIRRQFIPWISSLEEAVGYNAAAEKIGTPAKVHLKFDTGMGRIGLLELEAAEVLKALPNLAFLKVEGAASHFPVADEDIAYTREQSARFFALLAEYELNPPIIHIQNSAATLESYPTGQATLVRAGLAIYGISPMPEYQHLLKPILTWKTRVTLSRELPAGHGVSYGRTFITKTRTPVASLAVGYADGYQRHLSNQGAHVLIRGKRCPLLGRVTMDQIMVDLTEVGLVPPGEEAILIGSEGDETILASDLARLSGTIAWEIFTGIGSRVQRVVL